MTAVPPPAGPTPLTEAPSQVLPAATDHRTAGGPERALRWWALAALAVAVVVGVYLRAVNVHGVPVGRHAFRQTQTAYTAAVFARDGIDLMHTPLPVFGPQADVPFEMPLFQAVAVGVMRVSGWNVDDACRLTHLLFFLLSAAALYLLGRLLFDTPTAAVGAAVYLTSPLTLYWSVRSLMEFMAVFFALLYAAAFVLGVRRPGRGWAWALALTAGCLGALVKVTTMAVVVPVVLTAYWLYAWRGPRRARWPVHAAALAAMAVPVLVGQAWVIHADRIKAASPLTRWLTSAALKDWNYGTPAQRLDPSNWLSILGRIDTFVAPSIVAALAVAAAWPWGGDRRRWVLAMAVLGGAVLPVAVFFNLYVVHDYYQCAIAPVLALAAGAGAVAVGRTWRLGLPLALAGVLWAQYAGYGYAGPSYRETVAASPVAATGEFVGRITPPDGYVLVRLNTWDPTLLYFARRGGLMWYVPERPDCACTEADLLAAVRDMGPDRVRTIVTLDPQDPLFRHWRTVRPVRAEGGLYVASLADPVGF